MSGTRPLSQIQQWMMAAITAPGGAGDGMSSASARDAIDVSPAGLDAVILPSRRLDALSRLQIYSNAYFLRLIECLGEDYPAVKAALGETTFGAFAVEYLQRHPPRSYTLNDLGAGFPGFLQETKPAEEGAGGWADFLINLSRLERHYTEVFDGPGTESTPPLTADDLRRIPAGTWPDCRLLPVPCLRLDFFGFPVHEYATAVRRGDNNPAVPDRREIHLVITRRNYVVRRTSVGPAEFDLLSNLVAGSAVGAAIAATAERHEAELAEHLSQWFAGWGAAGYFASVEIPTY